MTTEQLRLLLELIRYMVLRATHPQTPPRNYTEEIERLTEELEGLCDDRLDRT